MFRLSKYKSECDDCGEFKNYITLKDFLWDKNNPDLWVLCLECFLVRQRDILHWQDPD